MSNDNLPNVPWVLGEYWPPVVEREIKGFEIVTSEPDPYHGIELRPVHLKAGTILRIDMPTDD